MKNSSQLPSPDTPEALTYIGWWLGFGTAMFAHAMEAVVPFPRRTESR